jgi:hypothetical protein
VRVLCRRNRDAARDDQGCDLGQVLPLEPLGHVLGGRVRHLVSEHRREPCVGLVRGKIPVKTTILPPGRQYALASFFRISVTFQTNDGLSRRATASIRLATRWTSA